MQRGFAPCRARGHSPPEWVTAHGLPASMIMLPGHELRFDKVFYFWGECGITYPDPITVATVLPPRQFSQVASGADNPTRVAWFLTSKPAILTRAGPARWPNGPLRCSIRTHVLGDNGTAWRRRRLFKSPIRFRSGSQGGSSDCDKTRSQAAAPMIRHSTVTR
jgi:hypothetical protein